MQLKISAEMLHSVEALEAQTLNEVASQKELSEEVKARLEKAVAAKNSAIKDYTDTSQSHPEADRSKGQNTRQDEVEATKKEDPSYFFQTLPDSDKSTGHRHCTSHTSQQELTFVSEDLVVAKKEIEKLQIELPPTQEMMDNLNSIQIAKDTAYLALEKALDLLEDRLKEKLVAANLASTQTFSEEAQSKSRQDSQNATKGLIVELAIIQSSVSQRKQTTSKPDTWRETLEGTSKAEQKSNVSSRKTDLKSSEAFANFQKARIGEVLAAENTRSKVDELEEVKTGLEKAVNENATLSSTIESLRIRWNIIKTELQALLYRQETALALVSATKGEIKKVKVDTAAALAAEISSKEVISAFAIGLQDMSVEADKAKVLHKEAIQEASNAKIAARQAKAAIITGEYNLQASYREAEVAKISEAIALKEIKYLSQPKKPHVTQNEPNAQTVDKEQFDSLHKKLEEAEELATEKVEEAMQLLKAEKAAQQELLNQFEGAMAEMEAIKSEKQQALLQAEEAEAAKVAVEGELRKWRAENGRRRAADSIAVATPSPRYSGRLAFPETPEKIHVKTDHFAEVFQLSLPPPAEKFYPENNKQAAPKKLKLFARITSFFSKKKNQVKA
ncbi:hypothetical protein O6H91_02G096900 [Diphasiastrum complanatum]|nr:hypothetical protein O6H91_02G096900 [Diphasiastrum complanatum]